MTATPFDAAAEFDRQAQTFVQLGYPELTGLGAAGFERIVAPLREVAVAHAGEATPPTRAHVPFLLVVDGDLVAAEDAVRLTALAGKSKPGFVDPHYAPGDLARFRPLPELGIPDAQAYLVLNIDRGAHTRNVTPEDAVADFTAQGRTPLTIAEGIALVMQFPEALEKNNCFSLVGSRCGDRRVPALWISQGAPKLGWCWNGNPHTWLGSASCAQRVAG